MKRRWKILIIVVALLGAGMLWAMVRHYQLRAATDAYIAQLEAQGEPMDLVQVLPPPVPPEQNSADIICQIAAVVWSDEQWWATNEVNPMAMVATGKAMIRWQQPEIRSDYHTNSWQEVESGIAKDKPALTLLRQIIHKPDFDFQPNYEAGVANPDNTNIGINISEAKLASERLSVETIDDLHNGDPTNAVENLRAMLAIAQALRDERLVTSELFRMAIVQVALAANWELLQSPNISDQQLTSLQNDWTNFDFIASGKNALAMGRVGGQISLARWRGSDSEVERLITIAPQVRAAFGLPPEPIWKRIIIKPELFMWRYWWSYEDELRSLKGQEVLMDTMRSIQTNGYFLNALQNQKDELSKLGIFKIDVGNEGYFTGNWDLHSIISESVLSMSAFVNRVMRAQVAKQMIVTAIAVKRYQLKHGDYPPDLNSLVPEFLPAVPLDPVDGKPLRYHPKFYRTFLLYSVGPNGKDDGGNLALENGSSSFYWLNNHALDWVWPQPATPEEIQNFYAHSSK